MPTSKPYTLVIDFETANYSATSACSLGLIVLEKQAPKKYQIVHREGFLIRPPTPMFTFTHIHGLTWSHVKEAKTFEEVWNTKLKPWFSSAAKLVAHNIAFDHRVLLATAAHYKIEVPLIRGECTVKLSRKILNIHPANLKNVSQTLGIELNHHESLSDATASAYIYLHAKTGEKPWLQPTLFDQSLPCAAKTVAKKTTRKSIASTLGLNSAKSRKVLESILKKK